jgi:hypothetical protein
LGLSLLWCEKRTVSWDFGEAQEIFKETPGTGDGIFTLSHGRFAFYICLLCAGIMIGFSEVLLSGEKTMTSDGVLFFGFVVRQPGDDTPDWQPALGEDGVDGDQFDFDTFLLDHVGLSGNASDSVKNKALRECPIELITFGYDDELGQAIIVRGAYIRAPEYKAVEIGDLSVDPEKIVAFRAWCDSIGIPYHEPQWMLASEMG